MSAAGRVRTGFSLPYVAVCSGDTYTSGQKLARGVDVTVSPESSDDNKFYADNHEAENDSGRLTGGTLSLTIREGENKVYVSVSNEGQTIPPEELPLVFDRFHKLDKSRSQNRDGWGLGLYIVKTIVCSHGENISVTSRDGKTEFTFTMPLVN